MVAPAPMATSTTCARNSSSVREASSGENSTSSHSSRARAHAARRQAQDFLLRHVELVLAVNGAGGEEHVDAAAGRRGQRARREFDVIRVAARQAADDRAVDFARHCRDALEVPARGRREAGLDDIHAEFSERACHAQLLGRVMLQPGDCSPSRSVVSKISTRSGLAAMGHFRDSRLGRGAPRPRGRRRATVISCAFPAATPCGRAAPRPPSRSGGRCHRAAASGSWPCRWRSP